jgi:2-polyprenyl-3-methyl-5-hydroxy-6-metoxy-1,4-benzoquinol methylase
MINKIRPCPICADPSSESSFPYAILLEGTRFGYYRCTACSSVFVDPIPDEITFARMYAKSDYHDCHYLKPNSTHYAKAATLLGNFTHRGSTVFDYGCGSGHFLRALVTNGFRGFGVEFDQAAADAASLYTECDVMSVADFYQQATKLSFDVIHLGDVLEHLPDPANTLKHLLLHLKPEGLLFVQGPLEVNPSLVYWASRAFGTLKHWLLPGFIGDGKPTHLFRTGGQQQLDFFHKVEPALELLHWEIYETGWPYSSGGVIKRLISRSAVLLGGKKIGRMTFGNRFIGIFRYSGV